jgi:hypothetical protein
VISLRIILYILWLRVMCGTVALYTNVAFLAEKGEVKPTMTPRARIHPVLSLCLNAFVFEGCPESFFNRTFEKYVVQLTGRLKSLPCCRNKQNKAWSLADNRRVKFAQFSE